MTTRAPNIIESLELDKLIVRSDHAEIGMQLILRGLVAPDEYGSNFSGVGRVQTASLGSSDSVESGKVQELRRKSMGVNQEPPVSNNTTP